MRILCRRRAESPNADAEAEKKRARLEKLAAWRSKQSGAAGGKPGAPAGGEPGAQDARAQPQEPGQVQASAQAPAQAPAEPLQQGKPEVWCAPWRQLCGCRADSASRMRHLLYFQRGRLH